MKIKTLLLITLMLVMSVVLATAGENEDKLASARHLVERRSYGDALKQYESVPDFLRKDPGLLIEWARVYTYANRHTEAIKLFEEVRINHPEREKDILRELADQYKWSDQSSKAIVLYEKALQDDKENRELEFAYAQSLAWSGRYDKALEFYRKGIEAGIGARVLEAMNGEAEILSWMDRLEDADAIYQKVLEKDPANLTAKNGRARIAVWEGYHRKGANLYKEILSLDSKNSDAIEGLAFAEHWGDRDDLATEHIEELLAREPGRHEAAELYYDIKGSRQLYVNNFNRYSSDQNKLAIYSNGTRGGLHLDGLTSIEGIYEWQRFMQKNNTGIEASRGGAGVYRRLTEDWEVHSFLYGTTFDEAEFSAFTTNTWITWRPDDIWRVDGAYDRETVEDIKALHNQILVNSGSMSLDCRPNRFWFFSSRFKRGQYSDENWQNTVFSKAEYRLWQKPYVKIYYNQYYSGFSRVVDHGYFNPRSIMSHTGGIYGSVDLTTKLFAEAQFSAGYEMQNPTSDHPIYSVGGGLNYRATENWLISLRADYFKADKDLNSDGYSKTSVYLSATYNFGANPPKLQAASQPYRATGQR